MHKNNLNMLKTPGDWGGFGGRARRVNDKCKRVHVWGWGDEGGGGWGWGVGRGERVRQ